MSTDFHLECDSSNHQQRHAMPIEPPRYQKTPASGRLFVLGFLMLAIWMERSVQLSAQTVEDSRVKAAYLYNFAKFVEWPAGAFRSADDPTVICVVGDERTSDVLESAMNGKKAAGKLVEARKPRSSSEMKSCHVLFIGFSDKQRIAQLLNQLQGASVLTVGQSDQFLSLGGMINLALKDSRIDLEIDPDASSAVGLKISSRLLVVGRIVRAARVGGQP